MGNSFWRWWGSSQRQEAQQQTDNTERDEVPAGTGRSKQCAEPERTREHWDYTFSKTDIEGDVGRPVVLKESFLRRSRGHLQAIEQEFETNFEMRVEVHTFLTEFKAKLGLHEQKATISDCFKRLGGLIGRRKTLTFNQNRIESEDTDDAVNEAVEKFNEMAGKCEALKVKLSQAEASIMEKISALEKESMCTSATENAIKRARKQASYLQDWSRHMEDIAEDAEGAAGYLLGVNTIELLSVKKE